MVVTGVWGIWPSRRQPGALAGLWLGHGAVLLLLLVHASLMATGQCAALMGALHGDLLPAS